MFGTTFLSFDRLLSASRALAKLTMPGVSGEQQTRRIESSRPCALPDGKPRGSAAPLACGEQLRVDTACRRQGGYRRPNPCTTEPLVSAAPHTAPLGAAVVLLHDVGVRHIARGAKVVLEVLPARLPRQISHVDARPAASGAPDTTSSATAATCRR